MDTNRRPEKALLVSIALPKVNPVETEGSVKELGRLVHTLGYTVVGKIGQKRNSTSGATVVGEGKLRELAAWTDGPGVVGPSVKAKKTKAAERLEAETETETENENETEEEVPSETEEVDRERPAQPEGPPEGVRADIVVFDCDLTPSQLRNLESATGVKVLDRTGVIIEIFSRHARTRTARLQVEIARLNYTAPRLRETGGGSERSGGGVGGKGAGESSLELDRRHIRDRIKELKIELEAVGHESQVRRQRRMEENSVALIGYTNAGKSSLMRALTGSDILVADKLFATLDTTVRPLHPISVPKVLVSDTVGFIKKLPHDLVASFRSTLDEALNADLLLYVVDASDPTFRQQLEVTRAVIREIGAEGLPGWILLNKRDRLEPKESATLQAEFPEAILFSNRNKEDLADLRTRILGFFEGGMEDFDLVVPFNIKGAIGEIRRQMNVLGESYNEWGVTLKVRAREDVVDKIRKKFKI